MNMCFKWNVEISIDIRFKLHTKFKYQCHSGFRTARFSCKLNKNDGEDSERWGKGERAWEWDVKYTISKCTQNYFKSMQFVCVYSDCGLTSKLISLLLYYPLSYLWKAMRKCTDKQRKRRLFYIDHNACQRRESQRVMMQQLFECKCNATFKVAEKFKLWNSLQ